MSKVGILSMQRIKNYGSFLQAYGLKSMIEDLGHEVQFVDYHIEEPVIKDKSKKNTTLSKGLNTLFGEGSLKHKIQYIKHKRNFNKYFYLLNLTIEPNYNPELDTLVIGSDEVFNCIQSNNNVGYSLELFGKDNNAKKIITYAASFGNTTIEKLKKYNKSNEIKNLLDKIEVISVRDKNSFNVVNNLTKKDPLFHLDPVLAYDYMNKCNCISDINISEKYIIVYAYSGRISKEESKFIKKYAKMKKLKVYSIGGAQSCADKFIDCSPFEVLSYFKNAEMIITDTFHGSIFSIITKSNFVTLVRKSVGTSYGNEEKLTFLLEQLNLKDRIVYDYEDISKVLDTEINYTKTFEIIEQERKNTLNYLKNNI